MCNRPQDGFFIGHVNDYNDTLNVHHSSGIYNKVFCILSKRSGWNIRTAFHTFVVANQHYWIPNATFQNGAEGVLRAAAKLKYQTEDVIYAFGQVGISCVIADPQEARKSREDEPPVRCFSRLLRAGELTAV